MKSFKSRYFFLAPMVVLALVACAKRDSEFAKRAAEAKAGAQKTETPATDSAKPTSPPAPELNPKSETKAYEGDVTDIVKDTCENPIKMEAQKGEKELVLSELFSDDQGSYVLQSTEFFSETQSEGEDSKNQLHATGSAYTLPEKFKSSTIAHDKIIVVCHTGKDGSKDKKVHKLNGSLRLPHEIHLDGKVKIFREDKVAIENTTIKTTSTLYEQDQDLKKMISEAKPEGLKFIILKQSNNDIVVKMQIIKTDEKTSETGLLSMSGTYTLKKPTQQNTKR